MAYTNSSLVNCKVMSPNHSGTRTHEIDTITPHCVVGQLSAENIGYCFDDTSREASCNYGIGTDGRVCLIVDEANRSWCTSSRANDQRAITIECASDKTEPYTMNDKVYNKLIDLCVDICKRNGKTKLLWFADKDKTLNYTPAKNEMVITVHRWFANKSCPGNWLYGRLDKVAAEVTKRLNPTVEKEEATTTTMYRVQVGAYSQKANADAQLAKVKAAGIDAFMVQVNGIYKIQVGAYSVKANADKQLAAVKAKGFDAFITTESGKAVSTTTPVKDELKVTGEWDRDTTLKTQKIFGTIQDGEVSHQLNSCKVYLEKCLTSSWEFDNTGKGSQLIKAIQKFLADLGYYKGTIDGLCGQKTVMAIQQFLNDRAYNCGKVDGFMGEKTVTAWQKYINNRL